MSISFSFWCIKIEMNRKKYAISKNKQDILKLFSDVNITLKISWKDIIEQQENNWEHK